MASKKVTAKKKQPSFVSYGQAGNTGLWGMPFTNEYISNLDFPHGIPVWEEMRRSDSQIKLILRAIKQPILSAGFTFQPYDDSPEAMETMKLTETIFFKNIKGGFTKVLGHALLFLDFGFSVLEKVYAYQIIEGKQVLAVSSLSARLPYTIKFFNAPSGELETITQYELNGKVHDIPASKCVLFANDQEGDNWAGVSVLRYCYKNWYIKSRLEKIDAAAHERFGLGVPVVRETNNEAKRSEAELDKFDSLVQNLTSMENGGAYLSGGALLEIVAPQGSGMSSSRIDSIHYHDEQIAKSILFMVASLGGKSGSGNRALGETFFDIFISSLASIADYVADQIQNGVVKEWCEFNGFTKVPKLISNPLSDIDAVTISTLVQAGVITKDEGIEKAMRKNLNLPEIKQTQTTLSHKTGCDCGGCKNIKLAENPRAQKMRQVEWDFCSKHFDVQKFSSDYDSAVHNLSMQLKSIGDKQKMAVVNQVMEGVDPLKVKTPDVKEMQTLLYDNLINQMQVSYGHQHDNFFRNGISSSVKFADKKYQWNKNTLNNYVEFTILKTRGLTVRQQTAIQEFAVNGRLQGLSGDPLREYILAQVADKIPDTQWETLANTIIGYGIAEGQKTAVAEMVASGEKIVAHYSPVLDSNLCDVCFDTYNAQGGEDGTHAVDDDNYATPNPDCLGNRGSGNNCRCINVYVALDQNADESGVGV